MSLYVQKSGNIKLDPRAYDDQYVTQFSPRLYHNVVGRFACPDHLESRANRGVSSTLDRSRVRGQMKDSRLSLSAEVRYGDNSLTSENNIWLRNLINNLQWASVEKEAKVLRKPYMDGSTGEGGKR